MILRESPDPRDEQEGDKESAVHSTSALILATTNSRFNQRRSLENSKVRRLNIPKIIQKECHIGLTAVRV